MPSDALYQELAKAYALPSRAFRDTEAGLNAVEAPIDAYKQSQIAKQQMFEAKLKPYEIYSKISDAAGPDVANSIFQKQGIPIPDMTSGSGGGTDYSKFGERKLAMDKNRQEISNSAPYTADQVRGQLSKNPELADSLIKAYPDGNIPSRALQNAISTIRPNVMQGGLDIRTQGMRDSLIKEARTTLDPFFQQGEGRNQAQRLNSIGRTTPLIDQMLSQPDGGDPRQMRELATRVDSVLRGSPGGQQAIQQINDLVPQTARGKFANWVEWYSNDPHGTEQQAFIHRYADTLGREKGAIQQQVKQVADRTAPTLRVLKSQFPEDYDAVVNQYMNGSPEIMGNQTPTGGQPKTYQKTAQNAQGVTIGTNDNWATFEPVQGAQ